MDDYLKLAKEAIENYVKTNQVISPPKDLLKEMKTKKAGVFVSLHQKDGSLRGCIGTFLPTKKNLAQEIIANAIAVTHDPRFPPLTEKELPHLVYSVDILSKPKLALKEEIDPKKYGLIVSTPDGRRGLLLPDIPDVKTPEEQITICQRKAGIFPGEKVSLQIFTVERHH